MHQFTSGGTIRLTQHTSDPYPTKVARLKSISSVRTTDEITTFNVDRRQWTGVRNATYILQGIRDNVANCKGWHGAGKNKFTGTYDLDI